MGTDIGSQLAEARKRRGISLKEAAAETKIRRTYLESFEANQFEIPLPDVYRDGFVRLYAKYLHLDVDAIAKALKAMCQSAEMSKRETREYLERLDLIEKGALIVAHKEGDGASAKEPAAAVTAAPASVMEWVARMPRWVVATAAGLACLMLVLTVTRMFSSSSTEAQVAALERLDNNTLILRAAGDVKVFVRQNNDKHVVFAGTLKKDEQKVLPCSGPLRVTFSEGNHIALQRGSGRSIQPQVRGPGWVNVD